MGMQKFGEGKIEPGEDVQKTASKEDPEEREQRLAALEEENVEADK